MKETLLERTTRFMGALLLQTVPPGLLAALAAHELSRATGMSFVQSTGIVASVLLLCMMDSALRD